MAKIKQFADTSAVSLAYAIDDAPDAASLTETEFHYIPYTQEGFQLSKDSQMSTAITSNRRPTGSKNTKGTASGSATLEFGDTPFVKDMLSLAMMSEWNVVMEDDGSGTEIATGEEWITDSDVPRFFVVEKRIRNTVGGVKKNFLERYYGNLVNEATLEIGSAEFVTMAVNTMAVFGDITDADATSDVNAGGLATDYLTPDNYEIADASNNVKNVVLKDAGGNALEVTFSDFSLAISNNVREQNAVGSEFTAGMTMGKVGVQASGTIYYYDDSILKTHLDNKYVSLEWEATMGGTTYKFLLPAAKAEAPNANAGGENQDYTQSLTLNGEAGTATVAGQAVNCVLAITKKTA